MILIARRLLFTALIFGGIAALLALAGLGVGCAAASTAPAAPAAVMPAERAPARVLVVYHSPGGRTARMAEAVARGAAKVDGVEVTLRPVAAVTWAEVAGADALILGCPVINANVTPEMQAFINGWKFEGAPLFDKLGAAFTTGGGISAGEEAVQLSLLRSMMIFGMITVGGADWTSAFGASAVTEEEPFADSMDPRFLAKGEALGKRVAGVAVGWSGPKTP